MRHRKNLVAIGLFILAASAWWVPLLGKTEKGQERSFFISARQYAFEPGILKVQRGDVVTITLEAVDAVHGLYLDGYDLNLQAEPGKSARGTIIADRSGKFKFRCSVTCGNLHPFMIGELRVTPNLPFIRAVISLLLIVAGSLIWFWPGKESGNVTF